MLHVLEWVLGASQAIKSEVSPEGRPLDEESSAAFSFGAQGQFLTKESWSRASSSAQLVASAATASSGRVQSPDPTCKDLNKEVRVIRFAGFELSTLCFLSFLLSFLEGRPAGWLAG